MSNINAPSNQESPYDPQTNKHQRISPTGSAMVESTKRMVGGGFPSGSLDAVAWTATTNGAGSASGAASSIATLTSGTANSGYATLISAQKARFLYASVNNFRGTFRIPVTGGANTTRSWGAFNFGSVPAISDGFYFNYDGSTSTLSLNSINGGVVTNTVSSGSFNGDVTSYTLNTVAHNFEILYQVATVYFLIDGVLLHKFSLGSSLASGDMSLYVGAVSKNSASGTVSASLEVWAMSIVRLGAAEPGPQGYHIATNSTFVIKIGPTTLHSVVVNSLGAASNTVTIYDNTAGSGTIIGIISASTGGPGTLRYDVDLSMGLTIVVASGTAADITVVYD